MDDQDRKDAMFERYGRPVKIDAGLALRVAGLRSKIHPRDAFACRYSSVEAAHAFADANRRYHGHEVFGPFETEVGPVNVVDLRRSLAGAGFAPCDPALPDRHKA